MTRTGSVLPLRNLRTFGARGWRRGLWRTWQGFTRVSMPTDARGIASRAVMAPRPGLAAFLSLYRLFADATRARDHFASLSGVVPRKCAFAGWRRDGAPGDGSGVDPELTCFVGLAVAFWRIEQELSRRSSKVTA